MLTKPDLNLIQVVFFRLFDQLYQELFRPFKKNFLDPLEITFQSLQQETCRPFKKNFLLPLERMFQPLQKEPCVPLKRTFYSLYKELFRPFRKNLGLLNFWTIFTRKRLCHSLFFIIIIIIIIISYFCMYYCKVQFITFCYTNNVNIILKIDFVFLFFLTLAGLLLKTFLSIQEQPQRMNKNCPRKDLTGFNKISKKQPCPTRSKSVK